MLVPMTQSFKVCHYDFTRFSLILTVHLVVDIPETVDGSWYDGQIYIGLKEIVFEPSSVLKCS